MVFHVINRGVRRLRLFDQDGDYRAWLNAFAEAQERVPVEVFAYCLMPNHFHLVARPRQDGHLAEFMRLGTVTHSMRWHFSRGTKGTGAVYQGRYKSFPVQTERYFFGLCRYVESNPLRASLVLRAEDWPWSSLAVRGKNLHPVQLSDWPILQPDNWVEEVNAVGPQAELDAIRRCIIKRIPLGDDTWSRAVAGPLGLAKGFRRCGRPRKKTRSGLVS